MSLLARLIKRNRCPQDGTKLEGKHGFCRTCRATWFPLLDGTAAPDAEPLDSRDYLRRKLAEIDGHKLAPNKLPPRALSQRQAGTRHGTLMNPRKAASLERARGRSIDTPVIGRKFNGG